MHTEFYIPPQAHYDQHKNLAEMYKDWKAIKDTFMRVIMGFALVGMTVATIFGVIISFFKDIPSWFKGH